MLVIFDCDGVLVDSEKLASEVFSRCLVTLGIPMSAEQCFQQFKGHTLDYCKNWLEQQHSSFPKDFLNLLEEETEIAFAQDLKPVPGVEKAIKTILATGFEICVASNGGHQKIKHSLEKTGLLKYFSNKCFSRDDVAEGKPKPELFLHAAMDMGYGAEQTIVIEDSITGYQAAIAAQMRVLLYVAPGHTLAVEAECFHYMHELPGLLGLPGTGGRC